MPVWGLGRKQHEKLMAVGGNIFSWDILYHLAREKNISLIHTHTMLRLGGLALLAANLRRIPIVVSVHGGVALPSETHDALVAPLRGGIEWGKALGALVRSRALLSRADGIIVPNRREANLLAQKYPRQRIRCIPHGLKLPPYEIDRRAHILEAYPMLRNNDYLVVLGRIDPTKNQLWLVEQVPQLLRDHPALKIVLVGPSMDPAYTLTLQNQIKTLGIENHVHLTGGLPPSDPRLVGLLQQAKALVLPSTSETFGLVLLEAWAVSTPVIASRTFGASELVRHGENGFLFDLDKPSEFHRAVRDTLSGKTGERLGKEGYRLVRREYDSAVAASRVHDFYGEVLKSKAVAIGTRERVAS